MKEAMSSLNKVLNKPVVPEDDFDRYGKIFANKLRKLSETASLQMMHEIDGLFIKRLNAIPSYFTRPSPTNTMHSEPTTSPTYYVRPESACTSYSDPGVKDHVPITLFKFCLTRLLVHQQIQSTLPTL